MIQTDELNVSRGWVALIVVSQKGAKGMGKVSWTADALTSFDPFVEATVIDGEHEGKVAIEAAGLRVTVGRAGVDDQQRIEPVNALVGAMRKDGFGRRRLDRGAFHLWLGEAVQKDDGLAGVLETALAV